jgi:hypothetical protein
MDRTRPGHGHRGTPRLLSSAPSIQWRGRPRVRARRAGPGAPGDGRGGPQTLRRPLARSRSPHTHRLQWFYDSLPCLFVRSNIAAGSTTAPPTNHCTLVCHMAMPYDVHHGASSVCIRARATAPSPQSKRRFAGAHRWPLYGRWGWEALEGMRRGRGAGRANCAAGTPVPPCNSARVYPPFRTSCPAPLLLMPPPDQNARVRPPPGGAYQDAVDPTCRHASIHFCLLEQCPGKLGQY